MSYEDVDEIKTQLHDAYMYACDFLGKYPGLGAAEGDALDTPKLKIVVRVEVKK